jgi:hypothetical protein
MEGLFLIASFAAVTQGTGALACAIAQLDLLRRIGPGGNVALPSRLTC